MEPTKTLSREEQRPGKIDQSNYSLNSLSQEDSGDEEQEKQVVTRKITQKYSMDKLMMMLDKKKLEALEEEFHQHPDGIKLGNFVWLMKASINHLVEDRFDLVYGLQKLFAEIDINADEHMEWSEFTQYIIDAVIQNQASQMKSSADLLQATRMMKFKKFYPSIVKDKTSHSSYIKSAVWCNKFQSIMVLETNQKFIKMLAPDLTPKFSINLPPSQKQVYIMDIDYSDEHKIFGCIDSNCNILFWEYLITLKLTKTIQSPCIQQKIKYLKAHKTWLTVGFDNIIREYDLKREQPLILTIEGHKKAILDIVEMQYPFAIASASLDTTIRIYSLVDREEVSVLTEHQKGVRSLTYNPNFGGFIISAGFERNIYVWSPEITQKKSLIGKLEGHTEIVVCVEFLHQKPFCVSIDEKFNIRFWDVRSLSGVQVIANETNAHVPCFGIFMQPGQEAFTVLSKRFLFYDTKKKDGLNNQKLQASEEIFPLMAEFNSYYLNFVIVTPLDIRIYNAKDGKLQNIIQNLLDPRTLANITAFSMDDRQRKFYVGDSAGGIRTYNISNGVHIKTVQEAFSKKQETFQMVHQMDSHEISSLTFLNLENHNTNLLCSSSWDSSMKIFDEEIPDESHLLRHSAGGHSKEDVCCMTVSPDLSMIATGSCSGIIAIWDFETNKIESICMEHNKSITSLHFLYPLPVLVSTCNEGYACFWGVKPCPLEYRNKLLKKIKNTLVEPEMTVPIINITAAKFKYLGQSGENRKPAMIIGDESGYIHQWDLNPLIEELKSMGFKHVQSICKYKLSFNPKKNALVNAQPNATNLLFFAESNAKKHEAVSSEETYKRKQWLAHQDSINSISFLENPDGIITCSHDKHVKLWSLEGTLWGDIYLLKEVYDKHWVYPFDWSEKKEQEIKKVKDIMTIIEGGDQPEEKVVFEDQKKENKITRERIDYLAKRVRRQEIEEQERRQQQRQVEREKQKQMNVQCVSPNMVTSQNQYQQNFKKELQKLEEKIYSKPAVKKGFPCVLSRDLEKKIEENLPKLNSRLAMQRQNSKDSGSEQTHSKKNSANTLPIKQSFAGEKYSISKLKKNKVHLKKFKNTDKNQQFNDTMLSRLQLKSQQSSQSLMNTNNQDNIQISMFDSANNKRTASQLNFYQPVQSGAIQFDNRLQPHQKTLMTPKSLKSALSNIQQSIRSSPSSAIRKTPKLHQPNLNQKHQTLAFSDSTPFLGSRGAETRPFSIISSPNASVFQGPQSNKRQGYTFKRDSQRLSEIATDLELFVDDDMNKPTNLMKQSDKMSALFGSSQRRCLVGIEAGGGRTPNAYFLKKLNNFITNVGSPQSKLSTQSKDVRYASGEGSRLLRVSYNRLQAEKKDLQTEEFGFKHKKAKVAPKNIFDSRTPLENDS